MNGSFVNKFQRTIKREGSFSGVGVHSGQKSTVFVKPASAHSGIRFFRNGSEIKTGSECIEDRESSAYRENLRCTSVGKGNDRILTVEHLSAALFGLEITNIDIHVDGPEIPVLDGSAKDFINFLEKLEPLDQPAPREIYKIKEPIFCYSDKSAVAIYPADEFSVAYTMDYDHPFLRNQKVDFCFKTGVFNKEIAPARTFCTEAEAGELKKLGFGLGANAENTLVIAESGLIDSDFRFPDECARHKVLDILGDLNLLGFSILGRVVGLRSGHALNQRLVEEIRKQKGRVMSQITKKNVSGFKEMNLEDIKKVLPHRYPFLMVDRVIEMKDMFIAGIKNVTGNEQFFEGHFPGKAIMPGVLVVEALAQIGGVLMLSKSEHKGKIAYLASITNARFRKVVVPGDQLKLEVEVLKIKSKIGICRGVAKVNGEEVCDAEFMFSLMPPLETV